MSARAADFFVESGCATTAEGSVYRAVGWHREDVMQGRERCLVAQHSLNFTEGKGLIEKEVFHERDLLEL